MNNRVIVCNFNLFDLHQNIFLIDPTADTYECIGISMVSDLGNTIAMLCNKHQTYHVHLVGLEGSAKVIAEELLAAMAQEYNNHEVKVDIN